MKEGAEHIRTRLWSEAAESDNPFAAAACYCSGYDVYGELLGRASWIEYLYLLFARERPGAEQVRLLDNCASYRRITLRYHPQYRQRRHVI